MQFHLPTRVQIMHADLIVSTGLRAILGKLSDMNLYVDEAPPAVRLARTILIADYRSGIALMRQHRDEDECVLVVTHCDKEGEIRHAIQAGGHGYLLQNCVPAEMEPALIAISNGQRYVSEAAMRSLAGSAHRDALTLRETDVLHLLCKGYCNKLIARELGIGVGTVKSHLKAVMSKLNVSARTQAVIAATQLGLLEPA